jgi:hypothetical protein
MEPLWTMHSIERATLHNSGSRATRNAPDKTAAREGATIDDGIVVEASRGRRGDERAPVVASGRRCTAHIERDVDDDSLKPVGCLRSVQLWRGPT